MKINSIKKTVLRSAATFAALLALTAAPAVITSVSFRLAWAAQNVGGISSYVEGTNCAFNVWGTTNLGAGITNYTKLACATNWALGPAMTDGSQWVTSGVFVMPAGQYFMYVTETNANGEAGPSNVAQNGPVPVGLQTLLIQR